MLLGAPVFHPSAKRLYPECRTLCSSLRQMEVLLHAARSESGADHGET